MSGIRRAVAWVTVVMMVAIVVGGAVPVRSALAADAGSKISITLSCNGNPERITIKNNTKSTIRVNSIGSIYKPRGNEPFSVSVAIGAGNSKTFTAGPGASGSLKLTSQYIFENSAGTSEGVKVVTSVGNKSKKCGSTSSGGGSTPKPTPKPSKPSCDPNYSGACVPVYPPDVDCTELNVDNFRVIGEDVHRLDRDKDGIACED